MWAAAAHSTSSVVVAEAILRAKSYSVSVRDWVTRMNSTCRFSRPASVPVKSAEMVKTSSATTDSSAETCSE